MQDFLGDIKTGQPVDYNSLVTVLCQRAKGSDDIIQLICMRWLQSLITLAKSQLKEQYADILAAVLPSLSHSKSAIAWVSLQTPLLYQPPLCPPFPPLPLPKTLPSSPGLT